MRNTGRPSVEAFVDKGFPDAQTFCTQFLYSSEFSSNTLKELVKGGKSRKKYDLAADLATSLQKGILQPCEILLAFVKQPRKWLSFQLGTCRQHPKMESAEKLLFQFGEDKWYGPIQDQSSAKIWYIRIKRVPFFEHTSQAKLDSEKPEDSIQKVHAIAEYSIRWSVIAEVGADYVALSWNGFRHNELKDDAVDSRIAAFIQFPYWNYIPSWFNDLSQHCQGQWKYPILHKLVLQDLWDKYLTDAHYTWRHLRIRADNKGVALNAHSTGASDNEDLTMRGLQALSTHLALSALKSLEIEKPPKEKVLSVESALLRTLIQEWGTKSYEFSLDQNQETDGAKERQRIFRAHCYFANGPSPSPQDSFQHLHCFTGNYGGSIQALQFLLAELQV